MTNLELLQKSVLFKGSSNEELELVLGLFQERQIKPNASIFTEKMPAEALYIIKSGSVRITMMAGEGEEMGLLILGPGEFFGELALIQEEVRLVSARAETRRIFSCSPGKIFRRLSIWIRVPHAASS
jgi:CRP/FNR family cyclic AMP-dependent transcriptional regulator